MLLHLIDRWRFFDQTAPRASFDPKHSFAIDDTLCQSVGTGDSPAVVRAWVHRPTVSLGIQDTRLPHLDEGLKWIKNRGYRYIVRNSGGLAVVLDEGVLNLSLILPDKQRLSIDDAFEAMVELVRHTLADYRLNIEAKEIVGSYCPGRYDLSVGGKKFAGIAQRRLRNGVAVQIYLCVTGSGAERAELIRAFYMIASGGDLSAHRCPDVRPEVMASLEELAGRALTISALTAALRRALSKNATVEDGALTAAETERYERDYARMLERNEKLLGPLAE